MIVRRRFLGGSAAVAAALGTLHLRPWTLLVDVIDAPLAEQLGRLLPISRSVRAVGAAYLDDHPEHRDLGRLLTAISDDLGLAPDAPPPDDLRPRVWQAVQRDFAARRTLRLEGWVSSPTEARLAALVVLQAT